MKFATALTFVAAVSASTLERKQEQTKQITEFQADCVPHSTQCNFAFTIGKAPFNTECRATVTGNHADSADRVPDVKEGACPNNAAYHWSATRDPRGNLNLAVWYPRDSRSNVTYCHQLPAPNFLVSNDGATRSEHYRGPKDFTVSFLECDLEKVAA